MDEIHAAPVVPINALFDAKGTGPNPEVDPRAALYVADVVFAVDAMTGNQTVVYGREKLEKTVKRGEASNLRILRVGLDMKTDELDRLCALLLAVRGECDDGEITIKRLRQTQ
jgi:hypothetical protein